eukprot:GILK01003710.1.p1 GENE.GILK01003710.1~~GILK01003710.1.p1  ORF type:complete len:535 (+),score=87.61 GILK01003710.1:42-1607(+)
MSAPSSYKKLEIKRFPRSTVRQTAEGRYWKRFKNVVLRKEISAVTSVDFNPVAPHDFAVASSTRIAIYNGKTSSVRKTIGRFKDIVYTGTWRRDGKLMVGGDATGVVKVFDMSTRSVLREYKGHQGALRAARFTLDNLHIVSCSDDKSVRFWDLGTGDSLRTWDAHTDYIRSLALNPTSPDVFATGSYDHTVRLWDTRTPNNESILKLDHGAPVESTLIFPGGGIAVSVGGLQMKIWDILGGGRLLQTVSNHQKTITQVAMDGSHSRLLTGSLDGHVKCYNVKDYKVTHSIKYPGPVVALGISPDNTHMVVGMNDGSLSIRRRQVQVAEEAEQQVRKSAQRAGSYRYFLRGQSQQASESDHQVESKRKVRLGEFDKFLKKFQYLNALDAALETRQPVVVVSMLQELIQRDGLKIALSGRDELTLEPLLSFLIKHITNPRYAALLIDVSNVLFDLYAPVMGQSMVVDEMFVRLQSRIAGEVRLQKQMYGLLGVLDMLMSAASNAHPATANPGLDQTTDITAI